MLNSGWSQKEFLGGDFFINERKKDFRMVLEMVDKVEKSSLLKEMPYEKRALIEHGKGIRRQITEENGCVNKFC